jgi:hypothetical protein
MMRQQFPNDWCSADQTLRGYDGPKVTFRLTVVPNHQPAFAGESDSVDAAFAKLMENFNKPKTEAFENARKLLEEAGFTISQPTPIQ